jgi:hypothetical protein
MIVPQFWAESRLRDRVGGRQVTVRRFGWSDASEADAHRHAAERAAEAMARIRAGEPVPRRERKLVYGGAAGLPIREEIVGREGAAVLTRNGYGAVCLNTPNVLFADIDFEPPLPPGLLWYVAAVAVAVLVAVAAAVAGWLQLLVMGALVWLLVGRGWPVAGLVRRAGEFQAWTAIDRFVARHPDWHLRVYRTPAGVRVLAVHRTFDPHEPEVAECFDALAVDPVYAQMCRLQSCFRARVSPKPWRIGIDEHIRPRPGVWPVAPHWLPARADWLARSEQAAEGFAACRFLYAIGDGPTDPAALAVQRLHDRLCRAESDLPLA